jgi:hypothetical protein
MRDRMLLGVFVPVVLLAIGRFAKPGESRGTRNARKRPAEHVWCRVVA